jgi:hypothetical protein
LSEEKRSSLDEKIAINLSKIPIQMAGNKERASAITSPIPGISARTVSTQHNPTPRIATGRKSMKLRNGVETHPKQQGRKPVSS